MEFGDGFGSVPFGGDGVASPPTGLVLPFGVVDSREPRVISHRFGTRDAMTIQRYYAGPGQRRLRIRVDDLDAVEKYNLIQLFIARRGSMEAWELTLHGRQDSETVNVRFANPSLDLAQVSATNWSAAFELIVEPNAVPSYTSTSTALRFPTPTHQLALTEAVQELIPIVRITPIDGAVHRVSDRQLTLDGESYAARLLDWSGISQSMYASDQAQFVLGDADGYWQTWINTVDFWGAIIEFSIFDVQQSVLVNFWKGQIEEWSQPNEKEFHVRAADSIPMRMPYPRRKITKADGFTLPADNQPVNVGGKKGVPSLVATSVSNETAYGRPLKDIWVDDAEAPLRVPCEVIAGRDESEYYAALGIVGRGPIGAFGALPIVQGGSALHYGTIDNQPHHGPGLNGLRRNIGGNPTTGSPAQANNNPDAGSHILALDEVGAPLPSEAVAPDGVAFLQIRRTDEKGIQPDNAISQHEMVAFVEEGLGGWVWSAPGSRSWVRGVTNPVWVAINTYLNGLNKLDALAAEQETLFDVAAAVSTAAVYDTVADKLVGSGTEKQFQFVGVVGEEKPLRDWLRDILACGLGYYTRAFGRLRVGTRWHSGAQETFDEGNILLDSLTLAGLTPEWNDLTITYACRDYNYQSHSIRFRIDDHVSKYGLRTGNINVVGVGTKSQATRLLTSLVREQVGGVDETEWVRARRLSFGTTTLALNVEVGTICSMKHWRMPDGVRNGAPESNYGEFIIETIRINRDWSINVEGRSTTDAMYNMLVGDKPADVEINPDVTTIDKLPGILSFVPHVYAPGVFTLDNCTLGEGANRGVHSLIATLIYLDDAVSDVWCTITALDGVSSTTNVTATANPGRVTPVETLDFAVGSFVLIDDPGNYEICQITAIAGSVWTLLRVWPGAPAGTSIFLFDFGAHPGGTRAYLLQTRKISWDASGGTYEDGSDTLQIPSRYDVDIPSVTVCAVVAAVKNRYNFGPWTVYPLDEASWPGMVTGSTDAAIVAPGPISDIVFNAVDYSDPTLARITGTADVPAILNNFDGCECFIIAHPGTVDESDVIPAGHQYHTGGGTFSFEFVIGRPEATETWRFFFVSRSPRITAQLITDTDDPDVTPYADVEITARPTATTNYPGPITSIAFSAPDYSDPFQVHLTGTATLPSALYNFDGCEVFITVGASEPIPAGYQAHEVGAAGPFTFEFLIGPRPIENETWRFWFVSRNSQMMAPFKRGAGADQTPYADVAVTARPEESAPAAPPDPLGISGVIVSADNNRYGIESTITPPASLGTAVSYEIQARTYEESGGVTPISEWIPLGYKLTGEDNILPSGHWPRPKTTEWVKLRVRCLNYIDVPGNWVNAASLIELSPWALAGASAPTGVSVTVTSPDDRSFGFLTEWNHPSPVGTTVDYSVEVRYWLDAGLTTPESDWIFLGGTWKDFLPSGPFPRMTDGATRWVKVRVTAKNYLGQAGTPVESSVVTVTAAPDLGETDFDGLKNPAGELGNQDWGVTGTVASESTVVWEGLGWRLPGNTSVNYLYQHVRSQPGINWRFAIMARNETNATCGACQITFKDKNFNPIGTFVETTCAADSTWRRVEKSAVAPANTAWIMVIPIYTTASHTSGNVYFDQCTLEAVTPSAATTETVAGATASAPQRSLPSGEKQYRFVMGWTAKSITADRVSVRVYHRVGGSTTGVLGDYDVTKGSGETDWWNAPPSTEAAVLRFHYVSQDGIESTGYTDVAVSVAGESAKPISGGAIVDLSITQAALADSAVITRVLGNLSVNSAKLADLAVEAAKLANSSVTSTKIANLAVGSAAIAALAVGTAHIQDLAVQNAKIGDLAVTNSKIGTAAINEAKIADLSVTNAKIASLSVGKLTAGTATFTGDMTIQNSGNVYIWGSGNLYVQPGTIYGTNAQFKSALNGWTINSGLSPQLIGDTNSLISSENYRFSFVADAAISFAVSAGKIACYDRAGSFRGWIPVLP